MVHGAFDSHDRGGLGARIRGEPWGGWIASAGIALLVAVIGWVVVGELTR